MAFEPFPEFKLEDSLGNKICPPMPEIIDSSQLFILRAFVNRSDHSNWNNIDIDHIKFGPNKTSFLPPTLMKTLIYY